MGETDPDQPDLADRADLLLPMALRVAATLRLADLIESGTTDAAGLAARCGADARSLAALLRHLVAHGVFEAPAPGVYALNGPARQLLDGDPSGLRGWLDLDGIGGRFDLAYTGLLEAVRTGRAAYASVHGRPFWDDVTVDPGRNAAFHEMMSGGEHGRRFAAFVAAYDWRGVRHVLDAGGGDGGLLEEVLRAQPGVRGTLVELPGRLAGARDRLAAAGLADRCEIVGGSFFDPLPPGAGVYLLSKVLDDWDDESAVAILRRCREAAGSSGRVVLVGGLPEERRPDGDARSDLMMLVLVGGRERSRDEVLAVVEQAGLAVSAARPEFTELVPA
jgi:hypothetical protein